jgi:UDP-N-acetylglucosamine 4-epimerase
MKILVTGGAGFIGSHLAEKLLQDSRVQKVRVLDNLITGSVDNIASFSSHPRFEFLKGDIRNFQTCLEACHDMDLISHQAALGSVPRSISDPLTTNEINITGTLNIFHAAKEKKIRRVVYASSSSVYGDHPELPKREATIGRPLSPYAVSKYVNELYAAVFAQLYDMEFIGLRYFNIFGPRQNPNGPYAAVIPQFMQAMLQNQQPVINGDGSHSRDFTYVDNAIQANILALFTQNKQALNQVYNIACGKQITLLQLFEHIKNISASPLNALHGPERKGDVKHSLADISKAENLLQYHPDTAAEEGLRKTFAWYSEKYKTSIPVAENG